MLTNVRYVAWNKRLFLFLYFLSALTDTAVSTFRQGDSVRLKMEEAMMDSEFLLGELNHFSIGYVHQVDDDGDVSSYAVFNKV